MDLKSLRVSTEIMTGLAFIAIGLLTQAAHIHGLLAVAMAPFGVGLILSDILAHVGKATRERVKIRIRRDD
jgi:hypothetical protein